MACPAVVAMYMHPLLLQTYSLFDTILIIDSEYDIKFASIINKNQYSIIKVILLSYTDFLYYISVISSVNLSKR